METPCPVCGCTADVFARGPVGENVLHLAVLFHTPESVKMAKYLIERFGPSLVNAPYQTRARMTERPGLYEGEVALHIAIVHKDLELVQFMLKHGARAGHAHDRRVLRARPGVFRRDPVRVRRVRRRPGYRQGAARSRGGERRRAQASGGDDRRGRVRQHRAAHVRAQQPARDARLSRR